MELLLKYFPDLTQKQIQEFASLQKIYSEWNEKINVISRKDIENLFERHILHSLSIAKFIQFSDKFFCSFLLRQKRTKKGAP